MNYFSKPQKDRGKVTIARFFLFLTLFIGITFLSMPLTENVYGQTTTTSPTTTDLNISCSPARSTYVQYSQAVWNSYLFNNSGKATFTWSGTELQSTSSMAQPVYNTPGVKTASLTVTDRGITKTVQCNGSITVLAPILTGWCSVSADTQSSSGSNAYTLRFISSVAGAATTTTYSWTGSEGLTGDKTEVTKVYNTPGVKTATMTARSGTQSLSVTCSANLDNSIITSTSTDLVSSCTPVPNHLYVRWNNQSSGQVPYNLSWSGTEGLYGTSTSVARTYTSEGTKDATVTVTAPGQTNTLTCQAVVASSTSPANGGGCFIATAAYGTDMDSHVQTLRNFRDKELMTNPIGEKFVETYYHISPPIADYIRDNEDLKFVVRTSLAPVIYVAEKMGYGAK